MEILEHFVAFSEYMNFINTHFDTVSPLSIVSINQPLFLQKTKPFYIQIRNSYLRLGFEFGLQRIWDLAIVCP